MAVDLPSVLTYLGAFESGRAIALIDPALDADVLAGLVSRFRPAAVLSASGDAPAGYSARGADWVRDSAEGVTPHPDLAVLLPTSGSTGNPKLVRLSRAGDPGQRRRHRAGAAHRRRRGRAHAACRCTTATACRC